MTTCRKKTMEGFCNCPVGTTELELKSILPVLTVTRKAGIDVNVIESAARKMLGISETKTFPACEGLSDIEEDIIKIQMDGVGIERIDDLSRFTNLLELSVIGNRVGTIDGNRLPPSIEVLDASANPLTKLENLDKIPNLEVLKISSTKKLEGIDEMAKVPELENVDLTARPRIINPGMMIGDIKVGNMSKHLKGKDVMILKASARGKVFSYNDIGNTNRNLCDIHYHEKTGLLMNNLGLNEIPACVTMEDAKQVVLSNNDIGTLDPLVKTADNEDVTMPWLKKLYLDNNKLKKLKKMNAPGLEVLDVSGNSIKVLENLVYPNLKELNLSGNNLESIGGTRKKPVDFNLFQTSSKIKRLDVSNNSISTRQGIAMIAQLPNLEQLDLSGNPMTKVTCRDKRKMRVISLRGVLGKKEVKELRKCL